MILLRRDDVIKYIYSRGVVFCCLPEGGLSFAPLVCLKRACVSDELFVRYVQNDLNRQQQAYPLQEAPMR